MRVFSRKSALGTNRASVRHQRVNGDRPMDSMITEIELRRREASLRRIESDAPSGDQVHQKPTLWGGTTDSKRHDIPIDEKRLTHRNW